MKISVCQSFFCVCVSILIVFWLFQLFFICCIKIVFIISYWFVVEEEEEKIISIFKSKICLKKSTNLLLNFVDFLVFLNFKKIFGDFLWNLETFICINNYFNYVFCKILSIHFIFYGAILATVYFVELFYCSSD